MSKVSVRASRPEDVPAITAIYGLHVRTGLASFELEPPDAAEIARRRRAVLDAGLPFLVAEMDGQVMGYSYAGPYRPRPAYGNTVENSVYVAAEGHRRGIGRALLKALIEACARQGKRQMVAVIGDSDNRASIELHRAMGFREVGTLKDIGYKHGRWVDSVLMQRALGPGGETPPTG
jgi:L-amino acid N-acyltransferase YncA